MEDKICALLVHDGRGDQLSSLKQNLDDIVGVAKTCGEAAHYLQKPNPPHLVFTASAPSPSLRRCAARRPASIRRE